jgi:polyhydroxyalkanoate synthesis regulator phasin
MLNLRTMTKRFIMNEGAKKLVDWKSLVQSIDEALSSLNPKSLRDSRRIELARHNLKEVKSHLRRANERVATLEEQLRILEENVKGKKDK